MQNKLSTSRRRAIKSTVFGILAVSIPNIVFSRNSLTISDKPISQKDLFHRYPSIDDTIVEEIVGASHFDFEKVKKMLDHRPELARATWDWGFGDWETAIGAASHVGRRDIVELLISHGARPDIFTFAMLGDYLVVRSMVEAHPGIQTIGGPHGISLLQHAKNGLRAKEISPAQREKGLKLVNYLQELGNADNQEDYIEMQPEKKEKYLGDYKYGKGPKDGFSVRLNMRKLLSLGKIDKFGGTLYQIAPNKFIYNGTTSVTISFKAEKGQIVSLTVQEPDLTLTAKKV